MTAPKYEIFMVISSFSKIWLSKISFAPKCGNADSSKRGDHDKGKQNKLHSTINITLAVDINIISNNLSQNYDCV